MIWESHPEPHYDLVISGQVEAEICFDAGNTFCGELREWRLIVRGCLAGRFETLDDAKQAAVKAVRSGSGLHLVAAKVQA